VAAHTYATDRAYTVTVTVASADGQSRTSSFIATIANVAPVVLLNTPATGSVLKRSQSTAFKATFADQGTGDTHTCSITWGDGTSSTGIVVESGGAGTCTSSHAYSVNGTYTITVRVTDNSGAVATATSTVTVTTQGGTIIGVSGAPTIRLV
jgi:PKD repeat protein